MSVSVSIITPVYNSAKFINRCLMTTLSQSYIAFEHILVDDCSSDDSVKIIEEYAKTDPRIKLIRLAQNGGAGKARNTAIEYATGMFIAFLDADDYWHKDKLKIQVDFMLKNNYPLSYTQYYIVDQQSNPQKLVKPPSQVSYKNIIRNNYISCLTAMYNADAIGKYYMPLIRKRQDWSLWIKILRDIKIAHGIDEPLAFYRVGNSESLSNNKFKLIKFNFKVYRQELNMSIVESSYRIAIFLFYYFKFKLFNVKKL